MGNTNGINSFRLRELSFCNNSSIICLFLHIVNNRTSNLPFFSNHVLSSRAQLISSYTRIGQLIIAYVGKDSA